ncbi:MAG: hypothetical protein IT445_19560 [Phycisphaeraceae bacterium]|nr:hypothetical protein [Phycisphaeraceae bacterium]
MGLRETLNNNSSLVTILAVVVLVVALGIIVMTSKGPSGSASVVNVYFFDLNTNKLFITESSNFAPADAPSGPTDKGNKAGVMAYVYVCGECGSYDGMTADEVAATGAWISRLEMYTPEAIKAIEDAKTAGGDDAIMFMEPEMMDSMLIKRPKDTSWTPMGSNKGMVIMREEGTKTCPDGRPKLCLP